MRPIRGRKCIESWLRILLTRIGQVESFQTKMMKNKSLDYFLSIFDLVTAYYLHLSIIIHNLRRPVYRYVDYSLY